MNRRHGVESARHITPLPFTLALPLLCTPHGGEEDGVYSATCTQDLSRAHQAENECVACLPQVTLHRWHHGNYHGMWRTKWLWRRGLVIVICIAGAWALAAALAAGLLRRLLARLLLLVAGGRAVGCLLLRLLRSRVRQAAAADDLHRLVCVMSMHMNVQHSRQT